VQQQTGQIRQQADQLERSAPDAMHSDMVRQALDSAVQAFASPEGGNHAPSLRQTAQRVQPNTPLNAQMDGVRAFFQESRDAVRQLSDSGARL
jgi:hypothetical protein